MPEAPNPPSLYAKLAQVMAEVGYVQKRGWNDFHKYHYVTEADLVDAVRNELAVRNVVLIPAVLAVEERAVIGKDKRGNDKHSTVTTARMEFTFCDGDSGERASFEWSGAGEDPSDKGLYKAYTGAVKYFLMKTFLIPTGDDPEADTKTDERAAAPAPVVEDKISDAEARALYDDSRTAGIPDDKLLQAVAHVSQARASKLEELTGQQALKLGAWIEKKAMDAKVNDAGA